MSIKPQDDPSHPDYCVGTMMTRSPLYMERKGKGRWAEGHERRIKVLEALKTSRSVNEALEKAEVPINTYRAWRHRWPDFAMEVDAVRGANTGVDTRWLGDFTTFRKKYLDYDTYYHQQQIVRAIEYAPAQSVSIVLVPPEHGKTTVVEDWCTYAICKNPNIRITVVSEGQPHARKILRRVQRRLTNEKSKLWARFGPFYQIGQERQGKPWSTDFFTVAKAEHDERDYTLEARGWRSAVAGTRTDILIIDDVTSLRNHNQAETIVNTLRQDFFTRPGKTGHTIIVGTRVEVMDVYERLMGAYDDDFNPLITASVVLPALDEKGRSLCPEMWSEEQLKRKRSIVGESVWWRNYQQKPQAAGDLTFPEEVLQKSLVKVANLGDKLPNSHTLIGLDPALGGGNALVVWSYNETTMRVIDYDREFHLGRTEQIISKIDYLATKHGPIEDLIVEINAFQKGFAYDDRVKELAAKHGFRISPHLTGSGGASKLDEALGVGAMGTDMMAGKIEIVYGNDETRTKMENYLAELRTWRPSVPTRKLRQDLVMASWFGYLMIKSRMAVLKTMVATDGWKRKGMLFVPTDYSKVRVG